MSWFRLSVACLACLLAGSLCALPKQEPPPTPAQWQALQLQAADKAERIMHEANTRKRLLGRYEAMLAAATAGDANPAFPVIFGQYLSWYQTYIGDYPNAARSFSIQELLQSGDSPSPLDTGWMPHPAIDSIPELARDRKAVFFNEAHHLPLTRTLTVQLLARLREEGFDTFAAETLYASDDGLAARGYPIDGTGFYTQEPVCAEMVRTALKLGYRVVAYESETGDSGDARESAQARNLYERVFKHNPKARLVVDAGYAHIQEKGQYLGGSSMAQYFSRLSGIDPLTVEQTMLIPHPDPAHDHPYYTAVIRQLAPTQPLVFTDGHGKPWALRAGYDVSVFFPPEALHRGRPTWLALGGLRRAYPVSGEEACKANYPCLLEARYAGEGEDAVPADRLVFDPPPHYARVDRTQRPSAGMSASDLYLRPGRYRLLATDADGHILSRQNITVGGN